MSISFGEINWDTNIDSEIDNKKSVNTKDLYMKLKNGDNEVRIVTPAYKYSIHQYKPNEDDKGFGQKINCSATKENGGDCPLCKIGEKPSQKYYVGVIDRSTNTYKILNMSKMAMQQLSNYVKDQKYWGDPTKYDINIKQNPNGGPTGYYAVMPLGKSPLSPEDQVLKDKADLEYLKSRIVPPSPELVKEQMEKVLAGEPLWTPKQNKQAPQQVRKPVPAKKAPVPVAEDEDFQDAEM